MEVKQLIMKYDIVIDGSNLINEMVFIKGTEGAKGTRERQLVPSRLMKAIRKVEMLGYTPLVCIDRSTYSQVIKQSYPLEGTVEEFEKMINEEGIQMIIRDDELVKYSVDKGTMILTNDRFKEWINGTEISKFDLDWEQIINNSVRWKFGGVNNNLFIPELLKNPSPMRLNSASTTMELENLNHPVRSQGEGNYKGKKRGWIIKLLDVIFDNPRNPTPSVTPESAKITTPSVVKIDTVKPKITSPKQNQTKPKTTEISPKVLKSTDDFKEIIMQAIGEDEIRSSLFGSKIIKYQKTNDWSETGKKAFNTRFGFPKNQSYKATISTELSSEIEISGEGADVAYKRTSASETLTISSSSKGAVKKASAKAKGAANTEISQKVPKSTDDFKQIIMQAIGEDEVSSTFFGSKIIKYQKMNDWSETGKKAFNTRFGFPKNQSYKAIISTELSSEIEISGEGAAVTYKRKSVSQSSLERYLPSFETVDSKSMKIKEQNFPKITGFNTGEKGLKFPRNPDILANVLLLNARLEDGLTKKERVDIIHSKLVIGRTRVNGVLIRLVQLELIESKSPLEALAGLQSRFDSSADELGDWTPRNIESIQHYFQQAQVSLE